MFSIQRLRKQIILSLFETLLYKLYIHIGPEEIDYYLFVTSIMNSCNKQNTLLYQ